MEKDKIQLKQQLYQACATSLEDQIQAIQVHLDSITEARNNETKSSAGDKYETSRAMMQIEEDNSRKQMAEVLKVKGQLLMVKTDTIHTHAQLGSLVETNKGIYFLSVGVGRILLGGKTYFAISLASPIGKKLLNKKNGESIVFNTNKINILKIF